VIDKLRRKCRDGVATFYYATRDEEHNGALVLKAYFEHRHS
jgi:uncharacterized protein YeaO (DUF488 family)